MEINEIPSHEQVLEVLRGHKLIRLREKVEKSYLVGSFAKREFGEAIVRPDSDIDILLQVVPREGLTSIELEDSYRVSLRAFFVKNNIRGKDDLVHPNWNGRRIDLYLTYDASLESRPKIELNRAAPKNKSKIKP